MTATTGPPDLSGTWLSVDQAADLMGVGSSAVRERIRLGHLPSRLHAGRRWLRRPDVQVAINVRAFRTEMRSAGYVVHRH